MLGNTECGAQHSGEGREDRHARGRLWAEGRLLTGSRELNAAPRRLPVGDRGPKRRVSVQDRRSATVGAMYRRGLPRLSSPGKLRLRKPGNAVGMARITRLDFSAPVAQTVAYRLMFAI